MAHYDYDLFVIGAGSGGVRASRMSARFGARVAVAENRYLGGTCVNVGCVPKKLFVYGAEFSEAFDDAAGFGWSVGTRKFDWPTLRDNKTREIQRLNGVYERMLGDAGVTVMNGAARLAASSPPILPSWSGVRRGTASPSKAAMTGVTFHPLAVSICTRPLFIHSSESR